MKKISITIIVAGMLMGLSPFAAFAITPAQTNPPITETYPIRICPFDDLILQIGNTGDGVRALQSVLAQDAAIYPSGIITGYFGQLTQDAIRKLQAKNGLAQTGIIDEPTRQIIFPCANVQIISPNGGEVWKVGETHQITWQVQAPIYAPVRTYTTNNLESKTILHPITATRDTQPPTDVIYPFFTNLSIDLVDAETIVYHIGSASLYKNISLKWTIPSSIPQSSSYKIRISIWKNDPQPYDCKINCPMTTQFYPAPWRGYTWDESDLPFTILGNDIKSSPTPFPTPFPTPDPAILIQIRQQISNALNQLQNALMLLNTLLNLNGVAPVK